MVEAESTILVKLVREIEDLHLMTLQIQRVVISRFFGVDEITQV